ncbi:hypothetical protein [Candidatus Accumulibacter sp. ACC012]|mgnify:CR=1 FL=1|jgi:hypothetical protein|uniref:hypothetical protein n=1 Tax=Candidatus Accumulibacter sp. ACC012 TaxID=2823332 RepID=UPI0025C12DE3|nr:hypothetical protein [Candidatus Accumulibacter sp. ACC012]
MAAGRECRATVRRHRKGFILGKVLHGTGEQGIKSFETFGCGIRGFERPATNFWRLAGLSGMSGFKRLVIAAAASSQRPIWRLILSIAELHFTGSSSWTRAINFLLTSSNTNAPILKRAVQNA